MSQQSDAMLQWGCSWLAAATTAPTGEALASVAATRSAAYAAWRSYYAAHAALAAGDERLAEAAGLFSRAKQRAAEAEEAIEVSGVGAARQAVLGMLPPNHH